MNTIALFGMFGGGNLGNEATLWATTHMLKKRFPDASLVLISEAPCSKLLRGAFQKRFNHDPMPVSPVLEKLPYRLRRYARPFLQLIFEPIRILKIRKITANFDLFLVPGTGIADDYCQSPFDIPLTLLRWSRAVHANNIKLKYLNIGAGPVAHWLSKRWFRNSLKLADYRTFREKSSRDFSISLGINEKKNTVYPDIVFGIPVEKYLKQQSINWPPKVVGLGIMNYRGWNRNKDDGLIIYNCYKEKLNKLVNALLKKGFTVRIIIGNRNSDKRTSEELSQELMCVDNHNRVLFNIIETHEDVFKVISRCDLVIATRFHNVLKSLLLNRPVISIGYGKKNDDLMTEMGMSNYCHHIEHFDVSNVLDQVESLANMAEPPNKQVMQKLPEYRQTLENQFDHMLEL